MFCDERSRDMVKCALRLVSLTVLVTMAGCSLLRRGRGDVVLLPPRGMPAADSRRPAMMAPAPVSLEPVAGAMAGTAGREDATSQPLPSGWAEGTPAGKSPVAYRLKAADPIIIYLRGIPEGEQSVDQVIDESGAISLPYINSIQAGGRTPTEIEQAIRKAYLDQQIYKYVTVNVVVPSRSYFLRGEVRQAGRFPLVSDVTLVQAIAGAGGFTEFADAGNVEVIRGTRRFKVNIRELEKHPDRDKGIQAGDVIIVHRSFF